jgi:hypothetical protein
MRPTQLLDCQADLYDRWLTVPVFRRILGDTFGAAHIRHSAIDDVQIQSNARTLTDGLGRAVKMADCYRVKRDMCALVQHAAALLDESDILVPDLAPSPFGMVFFEDPMPVQDARGKTMLGHWLVWAQVVVDDGKGSKPGVASYWFNDVTLHPDEIARALMANLDTSRTLAQVGRWHIVGADVHPTGTEVGAPLSDVPLAQRLRIMEEGDTPHAFTNTLRYLHALWMLLGQTVAVVEDEYQSKKAVKRARQMGLPGRVTVVTLRRSDGGRQPGESLVEWRHRWIVKGHPRWQPYGERTACSHELGPVEVSAGHSVRRCLVPGCSHEVRRIWINPYIKGPDGLPIVQSEKVYDLAR